MLYNNKIYIFIRINKLAVEKSPEFVYFDFKNMSYSNYTSNYNNQSIRAKQRISQFEKTVLNRYLQTKSYQLSI